MPRLSLVIPAVLALASPAPAAPWTVRIERIQETSPDGLAHLEADLPVLAGPNRPAVRDAINQALREASGLDRRRREAQGFQRDYGAYRQGHPLDAGPAPKDALYDVRITCRVGMVDRDWVSFCFRTGGYAWPMATGFEEWQGCTFDARTGKPAELADVAGPGGRAGLVPRLRERLLQGDTSYFLDDWQARLEQAGMGFFLVPGAVVCFFPKYGIAAGVRGVVSVELPLESLNGKEDRR